MCLRKYQMENSTQQKPSTSFLIEAVVRRCFVKQVFLEISQNLQENTCARVSFLLKLLAWACNFIKKDTPAQVFSCEFCEISKYTFSYRTPPVAAYVTSSKQTSNKLVLCLLIVFVEQCNIIVTYCQFAFFSNLIILADFFLTFAAYFSWLPPFLSMASIINSESALQFFSISLMQQS